MAKINVLLIGSGGREHALGWAIAKSPSLQKLWACPGNPGLAGLAELLPRDYLDDIAKPERLIEFIATNAIGLVVIGPEAPLVAGLVDVLQDKGIACFGPSKAAAQLEGSKAFARDFASRHHIPQPAWQRFSDSDSARAYIDYIDSIASSSGKYVIKADGLAAGKGVVIAEDKSQAHATITAMLDEGAYGTASQTIVIEEYLDGTEASLFALCDGAMAIRFGSAQDYKRLKDGDQGPNTGGMGAISPAPALTPEIENLAWQEIIAPTLAGMARDGNPYHGFLYAGLMINQNRPKLIEFNCRFGDPEAQAIFPRLKTDLLAALLAASHGQLTPAHVGFTDATSVSVVMANRGYPQAIADNKAPIHGLETVVVDKGNCLVFHNGTTQKNDTIIASGGRVLTITGMGDKRETARSIAYDRVAKIGWGENNGGCFYRRDIGS